jgi:hypothetical protein
VILRRLLLLSLVAYCASLIGCASPDVMCGMKVDYATESLPELSGKVSLSWRFVPDADLPCLPNSYGCANCFDTAAGRACEVKLKRSASFRDVCSMAKQMHELGHVFGKSHD